MIRGREGDMVTLVAGVLQCAQPNPHREITMHMSSQQQDRGIADTSGVGEESDTDSDDEFPTRNNLTSTPVMPGNTHSFRPQRDPALHARSGPSGHIPQWYQGHMSLQRTEEEKPPGP